MFRLRAAVAGALTSLVLLAGCAVTTSSSPSSSSTGVSASASISSTSAVPAPPTSSAAGTPATTSALASGSSASTESSTSGDATITASSEGASTASLAATVAASTTPVLLAASNTATNPLGVMAADSVINVAKKVTPGVVQITNEQVQLGAMGNQAVPTGVGTGIVIDGQGHILTNNHVVAGASKLRVSLANGSKEYSATLVGSDPRTDLAVIQVSGANLTELPLGDSSKLQVGQWVVAIGNALALPGGPTVTAGVVSALGRTVQEPPPNSAPGGQGNNGVPAAQASNNNPCAPGSGSSAPYLFDAIQTSAPINPGNSGGPLVDLSGDVVGINTLVAGQAEPGVQAQGIGFAIAINTAKNIAGQLISGGHISYGYLGIGFVDNTPALAAQFGLPAVPGAAVTNVCPGSPAQQAGLAPKDVITGANNQPVQGASDLLRLLQPDKAGTAVTIQWAQAGTSQKLSKQVTLAPAPAQ